MAVARISGEQRFRPRPDVLPRTVAALGALVATLIFAGVLGVSFLLF